MQQILAACILSLCCGATDQPSVGIVRVKPWIEGPGTYLQLISRLSKLEDNLPDKSSKSEKLDCKAQDELAAALSMLKEDKFYNNVRWTRRR